MPHVVQITTASPRRPTSTRQTWRRRATTSASRSTPGIRSWTARTGRARAIRWTRFWATTSATKSPAGSTTRPSSARTTMRQTRTTTSSRSCPW